MQFHSVTKEDVRMANDGRILIADGDSVSQSLLSGMLGDGFEILCVESGEDALNRLSSFRPDVVLLGRVAGSMSGADVCARMKEDRGTAAIPVLFVIPAGKASAEDAALRAGGADCVAKPFHPAAVCARVRNYVELRRARESIELLSTTDPLTGLYNRRYFDRMLIAEVRRASRSRDRLSLIMLDVDRFKAYNDCNGHLAGDECLKLVCRTVKKHFRRLGDIVARYGGEELAVLLPSTGAEHTRTLAEAARKSVEGLHIPRTSVPGDGFMTVSAGVASMSPGPDSDPRSLLDEADKALYQAKTKGMNCVVGGK